MTTIALDAMGGDHAPRAEVEGAILAARELGVRILLVGIEAIVQQELDRHRHRGLPIEVVDVTRSSPDLAAHYSIFRRYLFELRTDLELPLLLLVDDRSRDNTAAIVERWARPGSARERRSTTWCTSPTTALSAAMSSSRPRPDSALCCSVNT